MEYPKLLIVSRLVWNDNSTSNTLTNLFEDYDPNKIARIYIETKQPHTKCCHSFFQISEYSLIKRIFIWKTVTGRIIDESACINIVEANSQKKVSNSEASLMTFVRSHRSWIFTYLREFLWAFNGWKTKELQNFIEDFNPDIIWLDGSPLILMNRLNNYVKKIANKPSVTFLMDDVYRYESCSGIMDKIYKYFLRKHVRETVKKCQHVFVSSPKMATVYSQIFGVQCTFIAKSLDTSTLIADAYSNYKEPIRLIYLGNVLYGRFDTLTTIAKYVNEINKNDLRIMLDVYSDSIVSRKAKFSFLKNKGVRFLPAVPYNQVPGLIDNSDVQVFVEDMDGKYKNIASLSFSTKIVDYLVSGKAILAVGPQGIAPIEYFRNEDAALVANSHEELRECLMSLCNEDILRCYAEKAIECGKKNHNRAMMDRRIYGILQTVAFAS